MGELPVHILHDEQHYVLDQIERLKGVVFVTGKAGTGKSTLFNLYHKITDKKTIVLAPTGIAAINVGGQTIHSFFRFPPGFINESDYHPISKSIMAKIELIVIDEISMVRADLLDHIDKILRISTRINKSFGGIPMLWLGDLYQLPPIVSTIEEKQYFKTHYKSPFFFSANVMNELESFEIIELTQVYRQSDNHFIKILNKIRVNTLDEDDLDTLNERCVPIPQLSHFPMISLCSTNAIANFINQSELSKLDSPPMVFQAKIKGNISFSQYPADPQLILKLGAQVMTIRNSPDKNYVNGSIGIIEEIQDSFILVKFPELQDAIKIEYFAWDIIKYKIHKDDLIKEVIGTFEQLPIRLAWAVTIHKCQGKTFDRIIVDLGRGAFESGQAYVALSRCRTLQGIYLKQKLTWKDIRTDERVAEFLSNHL